MYRDILWPVDLNEDSSWSSALRHVIEIAQSSGARLHVMTVVPSFGLSMVSQFFPKGYEEQALKTADQQLHAFAKQHIPESLGAVQHIVGHGTVYEQILKTAEQIGADLIIMASHRPELQDYLLGPNAARVVRHARQSVLVVRD